MLVLGPQGRLDRVEPRVGVVPAPERRGSAGLFGAADLEKPAWRLKRGRNASASRTPATAERPQTSFASLRSGQRLVDEIGQKDADGYGELIGGNESPPLRGGGEFRGIERGRDGGDAYAKSDYEPPKTRIGTFGANASIAAPTMNSAAAAKRARLRPKWSAT